MMLEQTIKIPDNRRVYFDLPRDIPDGAAEFEPFVTPFRKTNVRDPIENGFEKDAAAKTAKRTAEGRKPFEGLRGSLQNSGVFSGDPVEIIRKIRDEW